MHPKVRELIDAILALPNVDDVLTLSAEGGVPLIDGRWLVPLNVYLRWGREESLGIHVVDNIRTEDVFGG